MFQFNENYIFGVSSVSIALLCSFLLGLGDSCFNTQLYSILGCVYAEQSTPAFAIFKFIQVIPSCQFSDIVSGAEQSWVKMLSRQVWNKFTWSPIKKEKVQDSHLQLNLPFFAAKNGFSEEINLRNCGVFFKFSIKLHSFVCCKPICSVSHQAFVPFIRVSRGLRFLPIHPPACQSRRSPY